MLRTKATKIVIALTIVGAIIRAIKFSSKRTVTVTDLDDRLLADIGEKDVISHESVKVYVDNQLT